MLASLTAYVARLAAVVEPLRALLATRDAEIVTLKARIAELEARPVPTPEEIATLEQAFAIPIGEIEALIPAA